MDKPDIGTDAGNDSGSVTRDAVATTLTFSEEEEALLGQGLGAILMNNKVIDAERQRALAFESARRDPNKALTIMNGNNRGSFSEKRWAVELFEAAAERARDPDLIFEAFAAIDKQKGAMNVLQRMALKHPMAAAKNLITYYDLPEAENIFNRAYETAKGNGRSTILDWSSNRPETLKQYPWIQEIYMQIILAETNPAFIIQEAKRFGDCPWFQPAINRLPTLIESEEQLRWALWQVNDYAGQFPGSAAKAIREKLDPIDRKTLS